MNFQPNQIKVPKMPKGFFLTSAGGLVLSVGGYVLVNHCMYNVEGGHRAVIYNRIGGMSDVVKGEGTHFKLPWLQRPYLYNVRSTPRNIQSLTGSRDLQMVNIHLRIIFRPMVDKLPEMYRTLGLDYDERVLPSIANEVLKGVVAQYNAVELIGKREAVCSTLNCLAFAKELTRVCQRVHLLLLRSIRIAAISETLLFLLPIPWQRHTGSGCMDWVKTMHMHSWLGAHGILPTPVWIDTAMCHESVVSPRIGVCIPTGCCVLYEYPSAGAIQSGG
jgi:hypothetical protein